MNIVNAKKYNYYNDFCGFIDIVSTLEIKTYQIQNDVSKVKLNSNYILKFVTNLKDAGPMKPPSLSGISSVRNWKSPQRHTSYSINDLVKVSE